MRRGVYVTVGCPSVCLSDRLTAATVAASLLLSALRQEISIDGCGRGAGAVLHVPGLAANASRGEPTRKAQHRLMFNLAFIAGLL